MALPSLGAISMADYNTELQKSAGSQISMNDAGFRTITGKTQDQSTVSMTDGYGKSARTKITIKLTGTNYNYTLRNNLGASYVAGRTDIELTVDYNAVVGSSSTGTPALTIGGFTSGDTVKVINYGYIVGAGGNGGRGANTLYGDYVAYPGGAGGTAMSVSYATSIDNQGIIGGGGGGGGGSHLYYSCWYYCDYWGGNGGGGGAGSVVGQGGGGGNGTYPGVVGAAGTLMNGGAGGVGLLYYRGGGGGNLGQAGGTGQYCYNGVCNVAPYNYGGAGGAGGSATVGNANITWISAGLRYGGLN